MATKTNSITGYRWQRTHAALITGHTLTAKANRVENQRVLFRQSDLDGACSIHSLCCVLVTLNLARGVALTHMSQRRSGLPADLWRELAREVFFTGCMADQLVEGVNRLGLPLKLTARFEHDTDLDHFSLKNLHQGHLMMLSFRSVFNSKTHHWTTAIGLSGMQHGRSATVDTILMLDSSCDEIAMSSFNSRLRVQTPSAAKILLTKPAAKPIHWLYESNEWTAADVVRLTGAVCFKRNDK